MKTGAAYLGALLAAYLLLAGAAAAWWLMDTRPPLIDPARHLNVSLSYYRYLAGRPIAGCATAWFAPYHYYPPLIYVVSAVLYSVFGTSIFVAGSAVLLFLLLAALATFGIGKTLMDEKAGLLAAVLLMCYPLVVEDSKVYMTEVPLTAMVAASLCLLLRTRDFGERIPSLMLGVSLGLGMLTKWLFPAFVAGPLCLCAVRGLSRAPGGRDAGGAATFRARLCNLVAALLIAFAAASPWYLLHASRIWNDVSKYGYSDAGTQQAPPVFSLDSLVYYPYSLVDQLVQLPLAAAFCIGLAVLVRNKKPSPVLLSALIVPMCIMFFMRNKQARYMTPVLPSVAALTAMGLLTIESAPWRRGLAACAVAISAANVLAIDFGLPSRSCRLYLPLPGHDPVYFNHGQVCVIYQAGVPQSFFGPPRREDWKIDAILSDVQEFNRGSGNAAASLGLLTAARPCFSEQQFFYAIDRGGYRIRPYYLLYKLRRSDRLLRADLLSRCNYLLAAPLPGQADYEKLLASYVPSSFRLTPLKQYALPDGSTAYLYRCERGRAATESTEKAHPVHVETASGRIGEPAISIMSPPRPLSVSPSRALGFGIWDLGFSLGNRP